MSPEQDKTLEALQIALQMEIDGREYYRKASRSSSNESGKKLLASLAAEEDVHRQKFEEIYDAIRNRKDWPATDYRPGIDGSLKTVFAAAIEEIGDKAKTSDAEFDDVKTAMDMENKSYDFYQRHSEEAAYDAERDFYKTLAAAERGHYRVLLDYYEYLKDPAGWFVKKEHPSLDGG